MKTTRFTIIAVVFVVILGVAGFVYSNRNKKTDIAVNKNDQQQDSFDQSGQAG